MASDVKDTDEPIEPSGLGPAPRAVWSGMTSMATRSSRASMMRRWTRRPARGRPLSAAEKVHLLPYIPAVDLEQARVHVDRVPWYLMKQFVGITRGNHIYFRPGAYDGKSLEGIGLLGHELVHVGQYRCGMNWLKYLWSARYGYRHSAYERAAYSLEHSIRGQLSAGVDAIARSTPTILPISGHRD